MARKSSYAAAATDPARGVIDMTIDDDAPLLPEPAREFRIVTGAGNVSFLDDRREVSVWRNALPGERVPCWAYRILRTGTDPSITAVQGLL